MEYFINRKAIFVCLLFLPVICVYAYVGYSSYGFDDEFLNIWVIENFKPFEILNLDPSINQHHPNGSLFLNSILYNAFGDWSLIRAFMGIIFALSLCFSFIILSGNKENFHKAILFILLVLNPSLLMLGTSLRWYSIFLPLVNCLIILVYKNPKNSLVFWVLFLFLTFLLVNLNYLAFLLVPILFCFSTFQRSKKLKSEIPYLISFVLVSLYFSVNHISEFIFKLSNYSVEQFDSILKSVLGFALYQTSGFASIPFSYSGLLLISLSLILFITFFINFKTIPKRFLYVYLGLSTILIFSGLAWKFRNFYFLHAMDAYIKANIINSLPKKYGILIITLFVFSYLVGGYNSISHNNTMKGSWNLPYQKAVSEVNKIVREFDCKQTIIFNHNFGLSWHLNNNGYQTFNAYLPAEATETMTARITAVGQDNWKQISEKSVADCQIYLSTYIGSMEKITKKSLDDYFLNNKKYVKKVVIKKDKYADLKRILDKEIPDYYIELTLLRGK